MQNDYKSQRIQNSAVRLDFSSDRYTTVMESQQHGCLNKTQKIPTPVGIPRQLVDVFQGSIPGWRIINEQLTGNQSLLREGELVFHRDEAPDQVNIKWSTLEIHGRPHCKDSAGYVSVFIHLCVYLTIMTKEEDAVGLGVIWGRIQERVKGRSWENILIILIYDILPLTYIAMCFLQSRGGGTIINI